jgi:DNA repair protein RecN (Recombination protein N)
MLIELRVSDLALVTSATVIFGPGLNLLTGETGSGKSLVVDALGLCLGARASADQIRHGADSAVVDAVFRLDGEESKAVLAEMGFGPADEVILTREVGRNSRARINGRPATPAQLRRIGGVLVGIHGQHEQQALLDPDAQTLLLDAFCGAGKLRSEVEAAYSTKLRQQRALSELLQLRARGHKEEEYLRWQLQELEAAELVDGEEQSLVAERAVVRHSARLGELTTQAGTFLLDDEGIAQAVSGLMNAVELDPRLVPVLTRLEAVVDEVSEAAAELRRYSEQLDSDPQRLEEIEARLSQLDSIRRRFGGSVEAAIEERDRLRLQVGRTADLDSAIEEASSGVERASEALTQAAGSLSALRDEGARTLGDAVGSELRDLRLEDSAFQIDLLPRLETGPTGAEQAQMMFSANPGEPLGVLARVASGGELARVMLAADADLRRSRHWNRWRDRPPGRFALTGTGSILPSARGDPSRPDSGLRLPSPQSGQGARRRRP